METKESKILIGSIVDKYKKYNKTGINTYSNFLNLKDLKLVTSYLNHQKIKYNIYRPYDFLEKSIIMFGDYDNYITIYKGKISDKITHSNILGTLFSLGLENDMIGDIIVEDGYFYLTNLTRMNRYIEDNLIMIKNEIIELEKVDEIILKKEHFISSNILVSSMRLDNITSKIISKSRSIVDKMLIDKEILLNYEEIRNDSIGLKEGDILSIRKYGKYKIGKIKGYTKKNSIILEIIKYV